MANATHAPATNPDVVVSPPLSCSAMKRRLSSRRRGSYRVAEGWWFLVAAARDCDCDRDRDRDRDRDSLVDSRVGYARMASRAIR